MFSIVFHLPFAVVLCAHWTDRFYSSAETLILSHLPSLNDTRKRVILSWRDQSPLSGWECESTTNTFCSRKWRRGNSIRFSLSFVACISAAAIRHPHTCTCTDRLRASSHGDAVNIASIHYVEQTPSANNLCVMISQHEYVCSADSFIRSERNTLSALRLVQRARVHHYIGIRMAHIYVFRMLMYSLFLFWHSVLRESFRFACSLMSTTITWRANTRIVLITWINWARLIKANTREILYCWVKERTASNHRSLWFSRALRTPILIFLIYILLYVWEKV